MVETVPVVNRPKALSVGLFDADQNLIVLNND